MTPAVVPAVPPAVVDARNRWARLVPLALVAVTVAAYLTSFRGVFQFDDVRTIVQDRQLHQLWPVWPFLVGSTRPVSRLTFAINYALGGADPWGYHAVNLTIHVLAGLVLFGIVRRTLEGPACGERYRRAAPWLAGAIAAVWSTHPLLTTSVTYIVQRDESLMGLLFLLSVYCGVRACHAPRPRQWVAAAILACALGMGTKEVMAAAPLVMLVYDRTFVAGTFGEALRRRRVLYLGLAATWLVLAALLLRHSIPGAEALPGGMKKWPPLEYAVTQFGVILHYLRLAFWPHPLVLDYGWQPARTFLAIAPGALAVASLLGATALALYRRHWLGFAGAWFFLILAPTSSIVPIPDAAFEQRMYLPLAAVVAVAVMGSHALLVAAGARLGMADVARRAVEFATLGAVVVALAVATSYRNDDYASVVGLWTDNLAKRPDNPRVRNNLAAELLREGRIDEAIVHLRKAIELSPDYADARVNLGNALARQGRIEEAIAHYAAAVRIDPGNAVAHNGLGSALGVRNDLAGAATEFALAVRLDPNHAGARLNLGEALRRQGKAGEAIPHLTRAVELAPDNAAAHGALGAALLAERRPDEAVARLASALRLDPTSAEARQNMAAALFEQGKLAEAYAYAAESLRLDPGSAVAHYNAGKILARLGRRDEAAAEYREALRIHPVYANAHIALGTQLLEAGSLEPAVAHFAAAVRAEPGSVVARNNLAAALYAQGKLGEAVAQLTEAVRVNPRSADAQYNLANALLRMGKYGEALPHYDEALRIDPSLAGARESRAIAAARAGRSARTR